MDRSTDRELIRRAQALDAQAAAVAGVSLESRPGEKTRGMALRRLRAVAEGEAAELLSQADALRWAVVVRWRSLLDRQAERQAGRVPAEDLLQELCLGLFQGAERYNPDRQMAFGTYARWWVRSAAGDAFASAGVVRFNRKSWAKRAQIQQALRDGQTLDEAAALAGVEPELAVVLTQAHAPNRDAEAYGIADWHAETPDLDTPLSTAQEYARVERAMAKLPDRERYVLTRLYGLDGLPPQKGGELGRVEGVSRQRIQQLSKRGLQQLRARCA